jgi:hypothetical protein
MATTGLVGPFVGVLTVQLKRIEGEHSVLTYANLVLGVMLIVALAYPVMFMQGAIFRMDRSPESVLALSDAGWLAFIGMNGPALTEWVVIGALILRDTRAHPIFPRWSGYLQFWIAVLSAPAWAIYFFKDGPLAWGGIFCFWVPLVAFSGWLLAMTFVLLRAINEQAANPAEERPADPSTAAAIEAAVRRELTRIGMQQAPDPAHGDPRPV